MNVFKTFTFTWQQGLLFKWGVFAIGITVGAYWSEILSVIFSHSTDCARNHATAMRQSG